MPKIIGGNNSNQNQGTGANSEPQSSKKTPQQTPPAKSTSTPAEKASIAPKARLFQPAPQHATSSSIRKEIDLLKAFEFLGHDPKVYPKMIEAMQNGAFNLMLPDEDGDNFLHTAAYGGIEDFFDFVMNDKLIVAQMIKRIPPEIEDKNPINILNSKMNTSVLGNAIRNKHFGLALKLIREYGANPHQLVHDTLNEVNDNTTSMLRLAFTLYLKTSFAGDPNDLEKSPGYTVDQKVALLELCKELLSNGLTFFETPGSHCPPAFHIGIRRPIIGDGYKKFITDNKLTLDQFWILQNMMLLEKNSPEIFKLFCNEAQMVKAKNTNAQNILQVWNWYELNGRPQIESSTPTPFKSKII